MTRRSWLFTAAVAVPALVAGGLAYANAKNAKAAPGYICPITGETLSCEKCCPLNGDKEATAAKADEPTASEGYVCPETGEVLACPNCCPLNTTKK